MLGLRKGRTFPLHPAERPSPWRSKRLVVLAGTLTTFHLPGEGFSILLGVDALLDMARTSVNVLGNCLASAVVARWEGYKVG